MGLAGGPSGCVGAPRQSVTIPATLVGAVRRTAKEQRLTMSRALVALAERGVRAETEAKAQLKASYNRFLAENDPALENEAGEGSDPGDFP